MTSKEKIKEVALQLEAVTVEHEKALKGNKSAAQRFRKHLGNIKKMCSDLRKESLSWPIPEKKEG